MNAQRPLFALFLCLVFLGAAPASRAQWVTQEIVVKPGWSAVYLHVNSSHDTLHNLAGPGAASATPIQEVWMWIPNPVTQQFVLTPQEPLNPGSQWSAWKRATSQSSQLERLPGNVACLVYSSDSSDFVWRVTGRPVPPSNQWSVSGLNLVGFPTHAFQAPDFDAFLSQVPALLQNAEIFQYPGGELSSTPGSENPKKVNALRTTLVRRGEAYWMRSGAVFNNYYGPFEFVSADANGLDFGDSLSAISFRLRNQTANELTVSMNHFSSDWAPAGQTQEQGPPPLLLRGALNPVDLTYDYTNLPLEGMGSWTLAAKGLPGSEVEVVIGLNRSAIVADPGELLASVLYFSDSLNQTRIAIPVSATVSSSAGLWVGGADVNQVGHYLKSYQRDGTNNLVLTTNGNYVVTGTNTSLGSVPRSYPLRLIVHNPDGAAPATLLQHVFVGPDAQTNLVVTTQESVLNSALLSQARRISASHLPWSEENTGWSFAANLAGGGANAVTVPLDYRDRASNPFLHAYHPDHDNLDVSFRKEQPQGLESYSVTREIALTVAAPADDFVSLTRAGQRLSGVYAETIRLSGLARAGNTNDTRELQIRGTFHLNRILNAPTLTTDNP